MAHYDLFKNRFPHPDNDDDAISPDVAPRDRQPISPGEAVRLEQQKYGESSRGENRDDQFEAHHADIDEVV